MKINKKGDKRYLKFTMGFNRIPVTASFFSDQRYVSEDIALREVILSYTIKTDDIIVFDRGLQSRKAYEQLSEANFRFVTRLNPYVKYSILSELKIKSQKKSDDTLSIDHDSIVTLYDKKNNPTKGFYRLIISTKDGKPLYFLTNIEELHAFEIAHIYKQRWQIEVFFKFLKQHLNFSHLLSRNENGIKVILYTTLIAAILLTVFKSSNNYKDIKFQNSNSPINWKYYLLRTLSNCAVEIPK